MFSGLRTNSIFYVLDKSNEPTLQIGQVVSVSNPQPKFPPISPGSSLLNLWSLLLMCV